VFNINKTTKELSEKIDLLTANKQEKSKVLDEEKKQKVILEEEKNEKDQFVSKLKSRENEIAKEVAAKKKIERNLQSSIAAIVKREIEAARKRAEADAKKASLSTTETKSSVALPATSRKVNVLENTPEVTKVSVGFENNRGNLPWPVEKANVSSGFGKQQIEGTKLIEDNIGVTIQTISGAAVKAVFEGVVTTVYDVAGSQTVTIKHGKYFTTYFNLSNVSVAKGANVVMGQVIGRAADNDDGDGEIIFVVNIESTFVNPESWLKNR
jgi:septal ring factor EnvC (AmiA/AmiB activator)